MKTITTWTFNDRRFFAFNHNQKSFAIVDENGNNHGGWMSIEDFRHYQKTNNTIALLPLGKAIVSIKAI